MANGEVYVEVDASVVNGGIAPMAIVSGNPTPVDGQAYVVVWIRWRYENTTGDGGFTGNGWYFTDPNNILSARFATEDDFKEHLKTGVTDLDDVLSNWPAEKKAAFLNSHLSQLEAGGCLYFTANNT